MCFPVRKTPQQSSIFVRDFPSYKPPSWWYPQLKNSMFGDPMKPSMFVADRPMFHPWNPPFFGDFPIFSDLQVVALAKKPHEKAKATAVKALYRLKKSEEIAGKAWENLVKEMETWWEMSRKKRMFVEWGDWLDFFEQKSMRLCLKVVDVLPSERCFECCQNTAVESWNSRFWKIGRLESTFW